MRVLSVRSLSVAGLCLALTASLTACGGSDSTAPRQTGTLVFRLDAQTCTGTGEIRFFLDGNVLGTKTLTAGQSTSFADQPAGQHVVGASETATNGYVWPQQTVNIPTNGSYTAVLPCT